MSIFYSPLEQFDVKPLVFITFMGLDLTFFDIFIPFFLILLITLLVVYAKYYLKLIPYGFQLAAEFLVEFVLITIKNQIGVQGYIYAPFLCILFFFVLFANLFSLIPFGISLTSHFIILLWLSLTIGGAIVLLGVYIKHFEFLKVFIPEAPALLLPVLIIIEFFSFFIRCFSLAIRLAANMLAGHTLVAIIALFLVNIILVNIVLFSGGFLSMLAVLLLELGVCFLQAYVITILTCIYFNDVFGSGGH